MAEKILLSPVDFIKQLDSFITELDEKFKDLLKDFEAIEYEGLILEHPETTWQKALSEGYNYAGKLFLEVKNNGIENKILLSYIPFLTPRGTFVIDGRERIKLTMLIPDEDAEEDERYLSEVKDTRDLCSYKIEQANIIRDIKRYFGWLIKSIEEGKDIDKFLNVLEQQFNGEIDELFKNLSSVKISEGYRHKAFKIKDRDRKKFVEKQRHKREIRDIENFLEVPALFTGGTEELIRSVFNSQTGMRKYPFLDSTNPLSEVSHMRKVSFPGSEYSKKGRDIHPSHYGRLCIVETSESDKIGLRLHLAHKAEIDPESKKILMPIINLETGQPEKRFPAYDLFVADQQTELGGKVLIRGGEDGITVDTSRIKYKDAYIDQMFGYAALQVPFIQHNDPARALMGAKNLKQAVPLKEPEIPIILTGYEKEAAELSGRIIRADIDGEVIKVTNDQIIIKGKNGREMVYDLIYDVPIVASKAAVYQIPTVKEGDKVKNGQIITEGASIKDGNLALGANFLVAYMPYFGFNMDDGIVVSQKVAEKLTSIHIEEHEIKLEEGDMVEWLAPEGLRLQKGTPIAIIKHKKDKREILTKENMIGGTVTRSVLDTDCIRLWLKKEKPLEVGDKLMGRHGNKGIVAQILPKNEMPFFEIEINGKKKRKYIDVILNPHSVISRMNLGQIYETHLGWVATEHPDEKIRETAKTSGKPFNKIEMDKLSRWLQESGLDSKGRITLKVNGIDTLNPVVVGYQYVVKLNHLTTDKLSIRGKHGPVSFVTEIPLSRKKRGGGQRIGEMEVWALLAHGAWDIVKDLLGKESNAHVLDTGAVSISESLKALVYYLRGLGIALDFLADDNMVIEPEDFDKTGISKMEKYRVRWASDSEMMSWGRHRFVPKKRPEEKMKEYLERREETIEIRKGAKILLNLSELEPEYKEEMRYIELREPVELCDREVKILPVIPIRCRPMREDKINKLYRKILLKNIEIEKMDRSDLNYDKQVEQLRNKVKRLEDEIVIRIKGKEGIIRKAILGKRINFSSRAVIVPNPFIRADQVKVPTRIIDELGFKEGDVVLLNRQPTLHIHNVQAFNVIKSNNNAIAINPLVCGGFNADFDGDAMALYKTGKEIPQSMRVSEQIILAANGNLNLNLSLDIVSGVFYATGVEEGRKELEKIINDREIYSHFDGQIDKNCLKDIVYKYFLKKDSEDVEKSRGATLRLSEKIAEYGLKWATYSGLTFSIFDLNDIKLDSSEKGFSENEIKQIIDNRLKALSNSISTMILSGARGDFKQMNQMVGIKGMVDRMGGRKTSVKIPSCYLEGLSPTEYYLACFGARNSLGDKKLLTPECGYLTRRLVFAAADLYISEADCKTSNGFYFETPKVLGRTTAEEVTLNGNIIVGKDMIINEKVLEVLNKNGINSIKVRSPLTCEAKKGICSKCYGWYLTNRNEPPLRFRAGIMAAEVIGERATQDAMRTYHAGTATGTISLFTKVKAIFDNTVDPETKQKTSERINNFNDFVQIAYRLYEYYEKKVDIKHYEVMLRALTVGGNFKGTKGIIETRSILHRASFEKALDVFKDSASGEQVYPMSTIFERLFL
ncbi:MAG: hypothetical protein AB1480_09700 [Nitrospirota bacterium]